MSTRIVRSSTSLAGVAVGRRAVATVALLLGLACAPGVRAQVEGYRFLIPDVEATPGASVRMTVEAEHEESAQGFSFAARYPSEQLTIDRVHVEDTILEAIGADFVEAKVVPDDGIVLVGVLVDSQAPFEGDLIPNVGFAMALFHMELTVAQDATGTPAVQLENGLSTPPVDNLFSVRNQAVLVDELVQGRVLLPGVGSGQGEFFIRGDVNQDALVDISDAVATLRFSFHGDAALSCVAAADANDDDILDVSDPIRVLAFLFNNGPAIAMPFPHLGRDPTPGQLSCLRPAASGF